MLSGGIDSVWALHNHLTTTNAPIRTHHVHLHNHERRAEAEAAAVQRVLNWVRERGWAHRVIHTSSTTDYGTLRWIPRDHHTWGYWAGVILADPRNASITRVLRTYHLDSAPGGADSPTRVRADEAYRRPIEFITNRPMELVHTMLHMTKADVIRSLPREVLALCWWCRRPRAGRECHECHTCKQVNAVLRWDATPEGRTIMTTKEERNTRTLVALRSFYGLEGRIKRGDTFQANAERTAFLIGRGFAKPLSVGPAEVAVTGPAETKPLVPVHVGGGYYDVNGTRIRGKAAAEAEAARQAAGES